MILYDKEGKPIAFICDRRGKSKVVEKIKEETLKEKLKRVSKPKPFVHKCSYCSKDINALENYCECRYD